MAIAPPRTAPGGAHVEAHAWKAVVDFVRAHDRPVTLREVLTCDAAVDDAAVAHAVEAGHIARKLVGGLDVLWCPPTAPTAGAEGAMGEMHGGSVRGDAGDGAAGAPAAPSLEALRIQQREVERELRVWEEREAELDEHIERLHNYNDVKDYGQAVMGKLAEMEGSTTKAMYERFGLDLDD